jgi:hypothetical protein
MSFEDIPQSRPLREVIDDPDAPDVPVDGNWDSSRITAMDGEGPSGERLCRVEYANERGGIVRADVFEDNFGTWRLMASEQTGMSKETIDQQRERWRLRKALAPRKDRRERKLN